MSALSNYTEHLSPQTPSSEYTTETNQMISQIAVTVKEFKAIEKQLETDILAKSGKINLISEKSDELLKENNKLKEFTSEDHNRDQTAKGLYEEERNLYNLKLAEIGLYLSFISYIVYTFGDFTTLSQSVNN